MGSSNTPELNSGTYPCICFVMAKTWISRFFLLLQGGFAVKARTCSSVNDFLREQIGLGPDAIERIQSVFLDGRPVDDMDSAMIRDGSTLALSAAMPGLVGAALRRGGVYSSFRSTITYRETGAHCIAGEGFVRLKLFNLLMNESGPDFLEKGIFITSSDLTDFLEGQSPDFWQACRKVLLDGKPTEAGSWKDIARLSRHERIFLSVVIEEENGEHPS